MNTYKVFLRPKADGDTPAYEYQADAAVGWNEFPLSLYEHILSNADSSPHVPHTVYGGRRLLSKIEWRRLFTEPERNVLDEFEATYTELGLPDELVRALRSGYKNYYAADDVSLDDTDVGMMLTAFVHLGKLEPYRIGEVLNG